MAGISSQNHPGMGSRGKEWGNSMFGFEEEISRHSGG